jgi:hemoglobin-like flavoprotein
MLKSSIKSSLQPAKPSVDFSDLRPTLSVSEKKMLADSWEIIQEEGATFGVGTNSQGLSATSLFCEQLYDNLVAEQPSLKLLFPSLQAQSAVLAGIFRMLLKTIDRLEDLDNFLLQLSKRHSRIIGVEACHFELLGRALIQTFTDRLGDDWTPELEDAWIKVYSYLANFMLRAAADPRIEDVELYEAMRASSKAPTKSSPSSTSLSRRPSDALLSKTAAKSNTPPPRPNRPSVPSPATTQDLAVSDKVSARNLQLKSRGKARRRAGLDKDCVVM